jgi:hypothetical protein
VVDQNAWEETKFDMLAEDTERAMDGELSFNQARWRVIAEQRGVKLSMGRKMLRGDKCER